MIQSDILSIRALKKQFGPKDCPIFVLNDITFSFQQGNTYAITGRSGTGKSTLLALLAGLDTPTQGNIFFNMQDITRFDTTMQSEFLNQKIGLVFQQPYLIKELTVLENLMIPALIAGKPIDTSYARTLLQLVEIQGKENAKPATLSGGEQQRLALARALYNRPTFLIADEPTGNLDRKTGHTIVELLLRLYKEYQMSIIVSTHDQMVADAMQQHLELKDGKLYELQSRKNIA